MENQADRLYRSSSAKIIAGVCAGLAKHFKIDPTIVRVIFVFLAIFALGGVIAYVVLWIVLPEAPFDSQDFNSERMTDEF
ncbi:MAG: PspC domain-containing protein [Bacteroidales bacterium]|nr:PspC domain-containing protein [Bacteroidales bacterium]